MSDERQRNARVAVVMGSRSDWAVMEPCVRMLEELGIPHSRRVLSAHRTPDLMFAFAETAKDSGIEVIIACAGGAAHLPGMLAAKTLVPVLGVPAPVTALAGMDALLSIVQMPKGIPVGTLAIGTPGAVNAALLAAQILAIHDEILFEKLVAFRRSRAQAAAEEILP